MNTKTFAQQARRLLIDGVAKKLLYWGFDTKGNILEAPQKVSGGYSFRGDVFDDPNVLRLWESLKQAVQHKTIEVVVEEAAYTWFNRMMALRIMAKNGYEPTLLVNAEGLEHTPVLLQKARQGQYSFLNASEQERLKKIIGDYSKDQEAFSILLVGYCHSNTMLNNVFGKIDDYTELLLPDDMLQDSGFLHLLNTTDAISDEEYKEVELIGWLYQFYISEKKDEVFASFNKGKKAEAKDIPAATQIFTPNWIVKYMVQNTAGKIWLDKHPNSPLKASMKYLVENDNNVSSSVSFRAESRGENKAIINNVEELTLIDPAAGSGHILVEGFDLLYQMYKEEYYTPEEAVESILKNNLFGLDIDDRAAQLATFAILLKAAKYYRDIFSKGWLPNVYAMPEDQLQNWFTTKKYESIKDWNDLQGMQLATPVTIEWTENKKDVEVPKKVTFKAGTILNEKVVELLSNYYTEEISVDFSNELELFWGDFEKAYNYCDFFYAMNLLRQGKNLGSVIKCNIDIEVRNHIENTYHDWLQKEKKLELDIEEITILNTLKNYIPVLLLLTKKYTAVVANPPYMGQKNMNATLKNYIVSNYPLSKSDLFSVFMEVALDMNVKKGLMGMINQHSWMFLSSYEKLREHILSNFGIVNMLHLGPRTFEELSGEVVQSTAFVIEKDDKIKKATYYRLVDYKVLNEKESNFLNKNNVYKNISQDNFDKIPGKTIGYWLKGSWNKIFGNKYINDVVEVKAGSVTGNDNFFLRNWFEVSFGEINLFGNQIERYSKYHIFQKGGGPKKYYGNSEIVIKLEDFYSETFYNVSIRRGDKDFYFKKAVGWSQVGGNERTFRLIDNSVCGTATPTIYNIGICSDEYLCALLNTPISKTLLKLYNPTINLLTSDVGNIPFIFDKDRDQLITELCSKCICYSKKDWDSQETSWDFEQSPLLNNTTSVRIAYQKWQENVTQDFFQLHANEEELNRIFIDIYGLQEELTPEVPLKDITILQKELNGKDLEKLEPLFRGQGANAITLPINKAEVISQFISYAIGVFMGRYRLDKLGLNIAHPNPTAEELASYSYNEGKVTIDEDAILPLMGKNCNFPDDALQQINQLLDTIWGHETRIENSNFIQECLGRELEKFLVKDFYKYHCSMYKKKPIYWLFSSKTGAFQVLVYMHRMNAFTVEKIRANYMLEHLKNLRSEESMLQANSATLNTQDAKRLDQIRKDLVECEAYDMELKNVADQQITFDLDDGVTANYAKFESVLAKIK